MLYFLGAFVGLDFAPTPFLRAVTESPKQHTELARTALRRFVELDATFGPLVLVLDDLQWADDETLALVGDLAVGLSGSPIVLLAAARPEMLVRSGGWGEGASITRGSICATSSPTTPSRCSRICCRAARTSPRTPRNRRSR